MALIALFVAAGAAEATGRAWPRAPMAAEPFRAPGPGEQIVFEVRHSNAALVPYSVGFFITAGGDVKRFDSYDDDKARARRGTLPERPTHAQLMKTFGSHPKTVARIPAAELAAQRARIRGVRAGALVCATACYDAGGFGTTAWTLDGQGLYSPLRLGGGGDWACKNLAPDAQAILAWLRARPELARFYMGDVCTLPDRICKEDPCPGGGRPGTGRPCNDPAYCASVADCSWCWGMACVTAEDATKHCASGEPRCGNRCACLGHICAGGPAFCRDLPDGSIACSLLP